MLSRNPGRFDRLGGELVFGIKQGACVALAPCFSNRRLAEMRRRNRRDSLPLRTQDDKYSLTWAT